MRAQWPIFRAISRVAKDVQFHFRSMASLFLAHAARSYHKCANAAKFENILLNCYFQTIKHVSPRVWKYGKRKKRKRKTKQNKVKNKNKNKTKQKQHENMTSRKVLNRKRHCLEISKERWSIPSIKDFACQLEINFKQPVHVQTSATQTDSVLPAPSSEVSGIKQDCEFALHADILHDFCEFYQLWTARIYKMWQP